jgi:hypothetical protein
VSGLARCFDCQPGSYQDRRGATGSRVCPVGAYCAGEGASAPTPCPGGSWSNRTGLRSEHECTKVLRGEWAPLGSTQAEACPAAAAYCPGHAADEEGAPPGSRPLLLARGSSRRTRTVPVLAFELTLEAQLADYDEDDTKARLASLYNVSADAIAITLEAASLKLAIAIVPADRSAGGVAALRAAI